MDKYVKCCADAGVRDECLGICQQVFGVESGYYIELGVCENYVESISICQKNPN